MLVVNRQEECTWRKESPSTSPSGQGKQQKHCGDHPAIIALKGQRGYEVNRS